MLSKMSSIVEESVDDDSSMDLFDAVMDQHSSYFLDPPKPKISRAKKIDVDYWDSNWGKWMQNKDMLNPNSKFVFDFPFISFKGFLFQSAKKINFLLFIHLTLNPFPSSSNY